MLAEVRQALVDGNGELAARMLTPWVESEPDDFALARLLQDARCLGASEGELLRLQRVAREQAEAGGGWVEMLLAARLERDPEVMRMWLDRALHLRPSSAWVHYALAHLEALQGDWAEAALDLERALARDPAHVAARRMEAALLARRGQRGAAIAALELWIERTRDDPLVTKRERDQARLDLAQLLILDGKLSAARGVLEALRAEPGSLSRALAVEAALLQARGDLTAALEKCRAAQRADAADPLPVVQEALLLESTGEDPARALAAWKRVLELSRRGELGDLLLGLQARISLERGAKPPGDEAGDNPGAKPARSKALPQCRIGPGRPPQVLA